MPRQAPSASAHDAALVRRCRDGDERAWAELVDRFSRYVYAICTQAFRLPDADAEDVFQDVFVRVYERLDTVRDDEAIRPWIAQTTRRLCLDRLRAGRRAGDGDATGPVEAFDQAIERLDEALAVQGALERLPEHCREVLDRFFGRDESYETISRELGLPAGTVASRISRCLARLRDELAEDA